MKVSCYECEFGTWDEERRVNECGHIRAAFAVACQCFNGMCPYYAKKEAAPGSCNFQIGGEGINIKSF